MNSGFPEPSLAYRRGLDVLYSQFNDINIYVEDEGKENFYHLLFKRLLPGIKLTKLFPLGGKTNVLSEARVHCRSKKKFYLVDLDFDDVLGKQLHYQNLIYLNRYSIENYLFNKDAIYEQIREKTPSIRDADIQSRFNYGIELSNISSYLSKITLVSIVVMRYNLGVPCPSITEYDYRQYVVSGSYPPSITNFFSQVEASLKGIDRRFSLHAKIRLERRLVNNKQWIEYIKGKWILSLIKCTLKRNGLIIQKDDTSFAYALAKDVDLADFEFISQRIESVHGHH